MAIVSRAAAMKEILSENLPLCHEKEPLRRAIANLKFSATFTYLMEELGKIQTPSR